MFDHTFKQASVWSVVWRSFLTLIGIELFSLVLQYALPFQYADFITLLSSLTEYFLLYKIIISQITKQNLSSAAIAGNNDLNRRKFLPIALMTLLVAACGSLFIFPILRILLSFGPMFEALIPYIGLTEDTSSNLSAFLYFFPVGVIAAPIVEEIFFRGFILNKWAEKYGNVKGVIFSSLMFMILHLGSLMLPQLLVGLLCATVYIKTKKMIYPILVHALYNFSILASTLISSNESVEEIIVELAYPSAAFINELNLYSGLFAAAFVGTLIVLIRYGKQINKEQTPYLSNLPQEYAELDDIERFNDF